jgi:hypothetical protein
MTMDAATIGVRLAALRTAIDHIEAAEEAIADLPRDMREQVGWWLEDAYKSLTRSLGRVERHVVAISRIDRQIDGQTVQGVVVEGDEADRGETAPADRGCAGGAAAAHDGVAGDDGGGAAAADDGGGVGGRG